MVNMNKRDIRFKEQVGIVTSEATSDQFKFFVTPLTNSLGSLGVEKEDYVLVDHPFLGEACPLLAVVKELRNYEEVVGTSLRESKSVKTTASVEIIGCVDIRDPQVKFLRQAAIPPKPGSRVFLPYLEFLEDVFSRTYDGKPFKRPIYIGELESNANSREGGLKRLNFYFDSEDFTKHHILISAISGSGKTYAATVMVEEVVNKTGLPVVILDPYSEYTTVGVPGKRFNELKAIGKPGINDYPFSFEVSVHTFNSESVIKKLEKVGIDLKSDNRLTVQPFSSQFLKTSEDQFELKMKDELNEEVRHNRVTILDSKGLTQEETRRLFTSYVDTLLHNRLDERGEPFLLVVEEPRRLEPEVLYRIASEGRKLGVTMCILSQHPIEIDGRVLSQIGTHIMGRTTDATDLDYLKQIAGDKLSLLSHLRPGEWAVNNSNMDKIVKIHVRERYSLSI